MIRFLDKEKEMGLLEQLFDLLHENMAPIAPSELPYEEERRRWLTCVGLAMEKKPRQMVLILDGETIAGYLQYYVNEGIFMVEELQIRPEYRRGWAIVELWRFMADVIPKDTQWIHAYADIRNEHSQKIMRKLGMEEIKRSQEWKFVHFRGPMDRVFRFAAK